MALKRMHNDDAAQVGIGTMIVFIATILVAAVAAGVLIDTSQKLQDKSTSTGNAAVENVGTSLTVVAVWGDDAAGSDGDFDDIYLDVQLSSGAKSVNIEDIVITYNDGQTLNQYTTSALVLTEANGNHWADTVMRDDDGSFCDGTFGSCATLADVMNKDDLVRIGIGDSAAAATLDLGPSTDVSITITPPTGAPVSVGFTTPANIDGDAFIKLY